MLDNTQQSINRDIYQKITQHIPEWAKVVKSPENLEIKRLSGLSNACYRVTITNMDDKTLDNDFPKTLLFRKFEQKITDRNIEQNIFEAKSMDGTGPKLYFQNSEYRIEGFFNGRPITIWEMRNPMLYNKYADIICHYNFSAETTKRVQKINPFNKNKLFIHQVIKEWGPKLKANLAILRDALKSQNSGSNELSEQEIQYNLNVIDNIENTYLFDGYEEFFEKMIPMPTDNEENPTFPFVLCHNDAQENNVLMNLQDNHDLMVIDYEYAGWNPMAMDLANYINETMLDNSYPLKNGINWYLQNCMTEYEVEEMTKSYMECYFDTYMNEQVKNRYNNKKDEFIKIELQGFINQVYDCALLNNFFWGVWGLALLDKEECVKQGIFNYDFSQSRVEMHQMIQKINAARQEAMSD